jgi:hypothetical protein
MGKHLSKPELVLYKAIDEILWKDWDPIGVQWAKEAARDEYHSYLPKVFEIAKSDKSRQEISDYLLNIETEYMGLSGNKEKCDKIALLVLEARDKFLK